MPTYPVPYPNILLDEIAPFGTTSNRHFGKGVSVLLSSTDGIGVELVAAVGIEPPGGARLRLLCEACHPRRVEQTRAGSRVQNGIVRAGRAQSSIASPVVDAYAVEFLALPTVHAEADLHHGL